MKTPNEYREMEFIELFIALARLFKPQTYVELGVKKGYTIRRMAPYVKHAIGIDIAPLEVNPDWGNVTTIKSTTLDYAKSLAGRTPFIDMLFIDADHECGAVLNDFWAYFPYVRPGTGLILMHDTHPINQELLDPGYCHDAWIAAKQLSLRSTENQYEIVTLPGPWAGLSIVRKLGAHHLSWKTQEEQCQQ
jgi:predicted O-methyltransferase YrrM